MVVVAFSFALAFLVENGLMTKHDTSDDVKKGHMRDDQNHGTLIKSLLDSLPWNTSLDQTRVNFRHQQEETLYRNQCRSLLRQHPNVFSSSADGAVDPSLYAAESAILKSIMQAERTAFASGFLTFLATFLSIRYGPTLFITKFGSETRVKAFRESQKKFNQQNDNFLGHSAQLTINVIIASMAGWVGKRTYEIISTRQENSFSQIASIPLVPGRSAISDALCPSWVETYRNVPLTFWKGNSGDMREFKAIRLFAIHCQQRMEYEKRLLRKHRSDTCDKENIKETNIALPFPVDKVVRQEDVLSKEEMDLFMLDNDRLE